MKDKFFIDTNIFVYSFNSENPEKQQKSHAIIRNALMNRKGCISYQVIQEFINVATRKFVVPLSFDDCKKYFDKVLTPLCDQYPGICLYQSAMDVMERWRFSFYDSLIVAAALQSDCRILYSEDLQHNQKIRSLTVVNPFLESP
ncbi:MAG: PIN domain-containing protein [Desulfobacteraceae bacterium]|nr:MAG: PIN domain-containing protein [Desulfobacteraceae bacterium]